MRKAWIRFLSVVATLLLATGACAETAGLDYSIAEKLCKQLDAGSGFEGQLTLSSAATEGHSADALTTITPLVFDCAFIHVRSDAATKTKEEQRLTLALTDGEATASAVQLSLMDRTLYAQCDLLGEDWYVLDAAPTDTAAGSEPAAALSKLAMPAVAGFVLPLLTSSRTPEDLSAIISTYSTKIDLWMEGYRQSAALSKMDDGTTTLQIEYVIPPAAIKAQLKQMVYDLLNDSASLEKLTTILMPEQAQLYLNPAYQSFYFYAIDQLPLDGDFCISRTVSLKGDTLSLHLSLPLYDRDGGALTVTYDRTKGDGDLPDNNVILLTSDKLRMRLAYQEYSSLTDVNVYQGSFLREPLGLEGYEVGTEPADAAAKAISFQFLFKMQTTEGVNDDGKSTLAYNVDLTLTPDYTPNEAADDYTPPTDAQKNTFLTFSPLTVAFDATFTSGQAKNAATAINASLVLSGDELPQTITLSLDGKTRSKWVPSAFSPANAISLSGMNQDELSSLLSQIGVKAGLLLLPKISLPVASQAPVESTAP